MIVNASGRSLVFPDFLGPNIRSISNTRSILTEHTFGLGEDASSPAGPLLGGGSGVNVFAYCSPIGMLNIAGWF